MMSMAMGVLTVVMCYPGFVCVCVYVKVRG